MIATTLGAALALMSAVLFGVGDFVGGMAARRATPFQVLAISSTVATLLMTAAALLVRESWPSGQAMLWSAMAGFCGAIGLTALYKGLSVGRAAVVSPVSGVVAAVLPVIVAGVTHGLPEPVQLAGFGLALPAIWLVSSSGRRETDEGMLRALGLGLLAGVAFGFFFVFMARVPAGTIFGPMASVKGASMGVAFILLAVLRQPFPKLRGNPAALLAGVLDPSSNTLYFLATSYTRLDIAAVLSSLYPAVTVLCSRWFLKEKISPAQWVGLVLSVGAIMLITR